MHIAFDMELDKALSSALPSFDSYQKDYFLNNAYLMKINQKLTGNNNLQQPFEMSVKRIADLQKLVKNTTLTGVENSVYSKNEMSFKIENNDVMYPISSVLKYTDTQSTEDTFSPTIATTHANVDNFRWSSINKPWIPVPVVIYENDEIVCYIDPDSMASVRTGSPRLVLTYIKSPERLDFFSTTGPSFIPEIDEHVHSEIVSLAVDLAIENIESQRLQTHTQITQNKE